MLGDRQVGLEEDWIIEGMATAAMGSYPVADMQRTGIYGVDNLQKVDKALTTGLSIVGDDLFDEYLAQDFWVYVVVSGGEGLEYLGSVLSIGGARQQGIDRAFQSLFGKSLGELYWSWVKNQSLENVYPVGPTTGALCKMSGDALTSGLPIEVPEGEIFYPFGTTSAYDRPLPLTGKVIELKFSARRGALVKIEYEGCAGLQDPATKASCEMAARQFLKSKIYIEGESFCNTADAPVASENNGLRFLSGLDPTKRVFVVVANADPDGIHGYFISIE